MKTIKILRWTARILGGLILVLVLLFFFGEGLPELSTLTAHESRLLFSMLLMLIGTAFAFKWELVGSLLIIFGYILFAFFNQKLLPGPVLPIFLFTGILFLITAVKTKKMEV